MSRSRTSRVNAIVLRGRNLGEADRIFTVLTDARGKIDVVAKGVRRSRGRLAGRLEFMSDVALELHAGRSLDVAVDATVLVDRWRDLVEPECYAAASLVAELVDAFCETDLAVPEVYTLLRGWLAAAVKSANPAELLARFELRLLTVLGYGPSAESCVRCDRPLRGEPSWLDLEDGGLACDACRGGRGGLVVLDPADGENLRALARDAADPEGAAVVARAAAARVASLLVMHQLGRRPRSEAALAALRERGVADGGEATQR